METLQQIREDLRVFLKKKENDGFKMLSQILHFEPDKYVLIKSELINKEGEVLACGHAYERANKEGFIERCEIRSWQQVLYMFISEIPSLPKVK